MTDYDEIRTCCSGGAICRRCWGYIGGAVKVLDQVLRGKLREDSVLDYWYVIITDTQRPSYSETFAFRHLLWVYSGRRGIHCWISDAHAMTLTDDQRKSLVSFLEVVKGGKDQGKKVNVRGGDSELHPSIG